jgi:ATP-dependent RNA helicase SUPV3L1/SUV3
MIDGKSMSVDEAASAGQLQEPQDFSNVQGFQVVGAGVRANSDAELRDDAWRDALRLELEARAARFHQSVDASVVLANDGIIRWLGDPIAKLTSGPDLLTPRAVILTDDALPEGAREIIAARLELWLAATTRRLLGPLFALQVLQDESDAVRDLAGKLVQSLGILDREPIRNQIKGLDQNARATLRKHSVRFGAYYIYIPAVLKPAARVLAVQLWSLQAPGVNADALAQTLAPLASSGRTSLPHDHLISRENYRVAGFRPCGDRIVRVDIVERLADMIRAAFVERSAKDPSGQGDRIAARGFVVNGQMTSLTGCSGEHFASILRSLGFECVEMKRSDFVGHAPAIEPQPLGGGSAPGEVSEQPEPPRQEEGLSAAREQAVDPPADSVSEPETPDRAGLVAETAPRENPEGESRSEEPEAESPMEAALSPTAIAPSAAAASTVEEGSIPADTIAVWRPAQKARPHGRKGRHVRQTPNESLVRAPANAPPQDHDRSRAGGHSNRGEHFGKRGVPQPAPTGAGAAPPTAEQSSSPPAGEKRRQPAANRGMHRSHSNSGPQERTTVDPNSPFAKLAELRSLLEAQSKKRS